MIEQIVSFLTNLIISIISSTGYFGIFLLMTAESALIPIPSEVTMTFAGYLASIEKFNFWIVVLAGAFANLVGSWLAYRLGHWGEKHIVLTLIRKYGKYLLISEHEFDRSEKWFRKYGEKITFFSRVLPIVRTFISLPAGIARMNFWKFSIFTFLGSLIWSAFLSYIGFVLGKNWNSLHGYYQKFEYVIVGVGFLLVAYYIYHKVVKLIHKK
ncbi:DedA family protein [Candidatus Roizmanbacteria bacterium]|nr:DedA family protein [Candidatus Roizmanbacteria bacterium]